MGTDIFFNGVDYTGFQDDVNPANLLDYAALQNTGNVNLEDLVGIKWQFGSDDKIDFTVIHNEDGSYSVSGCSGVNTYFFTISETESGTIKMGNSAGTLMAGSEEDMAKESAFLSYMSEHFCGNEAQSTLEIRDGNLVIHGPDGHEITFSQKS